MGQLDSCHHAPVFAALAGHLGYDVTMMRKAIVPVHEGEDPRYKPVWQLLKAAKKDWERWGSDLVKAVSDLNREGALLPMTRHNEVLLRELMRDHEDAFLIRWAGPGVVANRRFDDLVRKGLVAADAASKDWIGLAYKTAKRLNMLRVHRISDGQVGDIEAVIGNAIKQGLDSRDKVMIGYVRRKAATYMRRPVAQATEAISRVLTQAEEGLVRETIAEGIKSKWSNAKLQRELKESVKGTSLTNNMTRVARTEMVNAHNQAGYIKLKAQAKRGGIEDPWVYKMVAPGACTHCKRIWGPPGGVNKFRLSFVEEREAAGGNFGIPAKEWGPVIGPIHPNCTEGPLAYWNAELVDAIEEMRKEVFAEYGKEGLLEGKT